MAMTAKWRNLLAVLPVFAVSPLSKCASTARNITCSFHDATIPGPRLIGPERQQAVEVSVKHDPGMLCHGPADSEGAPSLAFRNHQGCYLLESTVRFRGRDSVWTRVENADRSNELVLGVNPLPAGFRERVIGRLAAYTFGYDRDLPFRICHPRSERNFTTYGVPMTLQPI